MSTKKKTKAEEPKPKFFATPDLWRAWLEKNHASKTELWVGFHRTKSGKKSITWPQSVDEALCFGWIDGIRKTVDQTSYKIRFTPRRKTSIWSAVNVKRVAELTSEGRMTEAGQLAFSYRKEEKTGIYGHDRKEEAKLPQEWQSKFEKNKRAWTWYSDRAPWYRRIVIHWVMNAKKEETRQRRFDQLLTSCDQGLPIAALHRPAPAKKIATKR